MFSQAADRSAAAEQLYGQTLIFERQLTSA